MLSRAGILQSCDAHCHDLRTGLPYGEAQWDQNYFLKCMKLELIGE